MKVAFHRGTDAIAKIIKARTNSEFSHCEFVFSDNQIFSSIFGTGTRFATNADLVANPRSWVVVDIGDALNEPTLRDWCESHVQETYGTVGDICLLFDIKDLLPNQPFCSQVLTQGAQAQDVWTFAPPTQTVPQGVYLMACACSADRGLLAASFT